MFIEDARDQTAAAIKLLEAQKGDIGLGGVKVLTMAEFVDCANHQKLDRREKDLILDQAILLIDQFYAHLPFKRARYAVDPVQSLRLLRTQLDHISEIQFHQQVLSAFISLRDAHTFYGPPYPYRNSFAFLPFRMEAFHDAGHRRFMVTAVMEGFDHSGFGVEAEITRWNGMPVETAIEREAAIDPAGNPAARFARGLTRMAYRSLGFALPPLEDWVLLEYIPKNRKTGEENGILLPWNVLTQIAPDGYTRTAAAASIYQPVADAAECYRILCGRKQLIEERKRMYQAADQPYGVAAAHGDPDSQSQYPQVFEFQHSGGKAQPGGIDPSTLRDPNHPDRKFGYIRIKSFELAIAPVQGSAANANPSDLFVTEFKRILSLLQTHSPDGLILDVRSNAGGAIDAAERILQFLTPGQIQPSLFHFIVSRMTEHVADSLKHPGAAHSLPGFAEWQPWIDDLVGSLASGVATTGGVELTNTIQANDTGQVYQGPVTLIVDAQSYSATDIFAAGFKDNGVGTIIGTDENTGGGGADRWLHQELTDHLKGIPDVPLRHLSERNSNGVQMGLAIRRMSRVGTNQGATVEDFGVARDLGHSITRHDLLKNSRDLIAFACRELGARPTYSLRIVKAELGDAGIELTVESANLFRIECLVNSVPQCSFAANATQPFHVPVDALTQAPGRIDVLGYALVPEGSGLPSKRKVPLQHPRRLRMELQLVASARQEFTGQPPKTNDGSATPNSTSETPNSTSATPNSR